MSRSTLGVLAVSCLATSSQAALFSFASDNDHTSWTFTGGGASVRDAQDPFDPQVLLIDDHNGPLPPIPVATEFEADLTITYLASVPLGGGAFVHNYRIMGAFSLLDDEGELLLSGMMTDGALTAIGGELSWFTTATIQASSGFVSFEWHGDAFPGYALFPGPSVGPDNVAFALSALNLDDEDVTLDPNTHLPADGWRSEGSFSGDGRFVPTPGAAFAVVLGGLVALRRHR